MPALRNRFTCPSQLRESTMWKARSPRVKPSWMNGISTRYISSGVWKNAQIWRYWPKRSTSKSDWFGHVAALPRIQDLWPEGVLCRKVSLGCLDATN